MEELSSILVNGHPECTILHAKIQKFSGGNTPGPPWREGATPSLHPPPARPSAVRGGASRPRLRGPSQLLILLESLPPPTLKQFPRPCLLRIHLFYSSSILTAAGHFLSMRKAKNKGPDNSRT